jgi:hypothetical protein
MQLTGTYAVIFYAVSLFKDIGVSTNPYIPAIITGKTPFVCILQFQRNLPWHFFYPQQDRSIKRVYTRTTASRRY